MHMNHRTDHFTTRDNLQLFAQHWEPDGTATARVVIVHGIVEHSGRYAETAAALTLAGFAVSAFDLRGHGQSAGPRCLIHNFDEYVGDLLELHPTASMSGTDVSIGSQHGRPDLPAGRLASIDSSRWDNRYWPCPASGRHDLSVAAKNRATGKHYFHGCG